MSEKKYDAEYVVVSTAVTDEVYAPDGTLSGQNLGGAGIYALCGLRLWTEHTALVTGVGEDFASAHRAWFRKNGCRSDGLLVKDPHTATTAVRYHPDGERTETAVYGRDHYGRLEATPAELEPWLRGAKGVYLFKDIPEEFWRELLALKAKYGFRLLWELNADAACPECRERVKALAQACEVFSLNRAEALALCGAESLSAARVELLTWKIPMVYLRKGKQGAEVLTNGGAKTVPSVPGVAEVDPTGAGNSSTAAVLYGFVEGYDALTCGLMGSISAAECIRQFGPPDFTEGSRPRAWHLLRKMGGGGKCTRAYE